MFYLWILKLNGIEINNGMKKNPIIDKNNWSYKLIFFENFLPIKDRIRPTEKEIAEQ